MGRVYAPGVNPGAKPPENIISVPGRSYTADELARRANIANQYGYEISEQERQRILQESGIDVGTLGAKIKTPQELQKEKESKLSPLVRQLSRTPPANYKSLSAPYKQNFLIKPEQKKSVREIYYTAYPERKSQQVREPPSELATKIIERTKAQPKAKNLAVEASRQLRVGYYSGVRETGQIIENPLKKGKELVSGGLATISYSARLAASPITKKVPSKEENPLRDVLTTKYGLSEFVGAGIVYEPIFANVGKVGRKGIGYARTLGGEKIPIEKLTTEKVLSGEKQFPTAESPKITSKVLKKEFEKAGYGYHSTGKETFLTETILKGKAKIKIGERPSVETGLHISPPETMAEGGISPYFLRQQQAKEYKLFGLEAQDLALTPTIYKVFPQSFERIPKKIREQGSQAMLSYLRKQQAGTGRAFISPAFELGKRELESVITPESFLKPKKTEKQFFTEYEGIRVPIKEYEALRAQKELIKKEKVLTTKQLKKQIEKGEYKPKTEYLISEKRFIGKYKTSERIEPYSNLKYNLRRTEQYDLPVYRTIREPERIYLPTYYPPVRPPTYRNPPYTTPQYLPPYSPPYRTPARRPPTYYPPYSPPTRLPPFYPPNLRKKKYYEPPKSKLRIRESSIKKLAYLKAQTIPESSPIRTTIFGEKNVYFTPKLYKQFSKQERTAFGFQSFPTQEEFARFGKRKTKRRKR